MVMLILGIESTCDETAAAVVRDGREVLSSAVATQFELHEKFRGVVPEIASRAHIENIIPVIRQATDIAAVRLQDVDAIAVAHRPGLIGSLLIGVTAAKTLAWSLGKPLIAVDHVQAHLYSVMLDHSDSGARPGIGGDVAAGALPLVPCPSIGLVISGGHTALYRVNDWNDITLIGSTIDDAVGEAYDKVAAMLALPFPGGPVIDRLAATGNPRAYDFPRTLLGRDSLDFSFSGLKTAVKYQVFGYQGRDRDASQLTQAQVADVAASFQAACIDILIHKINRAVSSIAAGAVIVGGGVSANRGLRDALRKTVTVPILMPAMQYCTDNAAMIAGLACIQARAGRFAALDLDAITHSAIARAAESCKSSNEG